MPKTKIVRKKKKRISVFRRVRVNGKVKFLHGAPQKLFSLYFDSLSPPNAKRSKIKTFLKVSLVALTLKTLHCVLKF